MKTTIAVFGCIALCFTQIAAAQPAVTRMAYDQCWANAGAWDVACIVLTVVDGHETVVGNGVSPRWSPDASKIVFTGSTNPAEVFSAWNSFAGVSVLNLADGTVTSLTTDAQYNNWGAAWSKDGSKIAFASQRDDWATELYVMDATGANQTRLTHGVGFTGTFAWSPDNMKFVIVSDRDGAPELYAIAADGSNLTRLTTNVGVTGAFTWSADGSRIAFDCVIDGNSDICSINSDGTNFVRLTSDAAKDSGATFSPVDDRIAFVTERFGRAEIAVMNTDGAVARVAPGTGGSQPVWSPDGNRIAFETTTPSFYTGLCYPGGGAHNADEFCMPVYRMDSVNADGSGQVAVAGGENPDWFRSLPGQPLAAFTSSCSGVACDFDAAGSIDADGTIASYQWQFGDGTTATGSTAHHEYGNGGNYGVSLIVTDDSGATGVARFGVAANSAPIASFTFTCNGPTCAFDGTASSDPDGAIVQYNWYFGGSWGGNASTASHTFATGTFPATLTVTDNGGATNTMVVSVTVVNALPIASFTTTCNGMTCTFNASASYDPDGQIFHYLWTFGDGTSLNDGPIVSHTFAAGATYTVTLAANDSYGSGYQSQTVTIAGANKPPVASLTSTCDQLMCQFNASASSDPDGTIANYFFDFGDGRTWSGGGYGPFHQYNVDGTYTVTLTVTDNGGLTAHATRVVTVALNKPPVASFVSTCSGFACSVNASASSDPDGTITSYGWNFGDGASGSGVTTSHTYAAAGTYTVTLTVIDNVGAMITQTQNLTVTTPAMHAGDLDGASTTQQNSWTATVTLSIHTGSHQPLANAVVSGKWNDGTTSSCTTNASGQCAAAKSGIAKKTGSVTFTVTNVTRATYAYNAAGNHDPDGDSNGTAITIIKP